MSLTVTIGPCTSGKSLAMFHAVNRAFEANAKIAIVLPENVRFSSRGFFSLNRSTGEESTPRDHTDQLQAFIVRKPDIRNPVIKQADRIFIDEAQFFNAKELKQFCLTAMALGKMVFAYGLNADFNQDHWEAISTVIGIATTVNLVLAVCIICGHDAQHSIKLEGDQNERVDTDKAKYAAVCHSCLSKKQMIFE